MYISAEDKLIDLTHKYETINAKFATKEAELFFADETRKVILAEEYKNAKYIKNNFGKFPSDTESNAIARSTKRFKDHIKDIKKLKEETIRLRGQRDAIKMEWESRRSIYSAEKAASKLNIGSQR